MISTTSRVAFILAFSTSLAILFLLFLSFADPLHSNDHLYPLVDEDRRQHGPITYIPFTFGFSMLLQTLRGYHFAEWPNIVIVDNSWDGLVYLRKEWLRERYGVLDVITTPVHLRFSQLQGFLDKLARDAGESFYFWSHTDILLLADDHQAYQRANQCIESKQERSASPNGLGVLFIDYDRLSAVSVTAGNAVPWDPATPQYGSDCDRYARMRSAGYEVGECQGIGYVAHVRAVMTEEEQDRFFGGEMSLEDRLAFTKTINQEGEEYGWRKGGTADHRDAITMADTEASKAEGEGGRVYMKAKWGEDWNCALEGRSPAFDVPTGTGNMDARPLEG